jgi:O-antigen/teichoic acid export membrane protein
MLMRDFLRSLCIAHLRPGTALAIDTAVAIIQLGGLLVLVMFDLLSVRAAYAVMGTACAVASVGWLLARKQPVRFKLRQALRDAAHNWQFAKWVLASHLVGDTARFLIPWVLVAVHGTSATGLLAACVTLVGVTNVFVAGLGKFITAKAAHAYTTGGLSSLRSVLATAAAVLVVVLGGCFLLFTVAGDLIAQVVYGDKFAGCGVVTAVLAGAVLLRSLGNLTGQGLWAIDRPRANFLPDLCMSLVTLAVLVFLVQPLGVLGAALAILAGVTAGGVMRCLAFVGLSETVGRVPEMS